MKKILFLLLILLQFSCARKGTIEGGPQDLDPPIMVKADPAYESTEFKSKKIKISFDEYIRLDKVNEQLIVSPPMKYPADISPLGTTSKFILIKIKDTLLENTTYTFNFGNSVIDNSEGNIYGDFKYVFSTGDYIDSLSISGSVSEALKPSLEETAKVLLYPVDSSYTDSIIFKEKGFYAGSTLDTTIFKISNLKEGTYRVIALKDKSSNYIYDPKEDEIGFLNEFLVLPRDSSEIHLSLFKEILPFEVQRPKEESMGHILFPYFGELPEDFELTKIAGGDEEFKTRLIQDPITDSLHYYYSPQWKDSIQFELRYGQNIDTFTTLLRSKTFDSLRFAINPRNLLGLKDSIAFVFNQPLKAFRPELVNLYDKDSSLVEYKNRISEDSLFVYLSFDIGEDNNYRLEVLPESFITMYESVRDSLEIKLKTKTREAYGNLFFEFRNCDNCPIIVEVLNKQLKVVRSKTTSSEQGVEFELLDAGEYIIRVIIDENANGKWDTGNFLKGKQAEPVIYLSEPLNIKANFDINQNIDLKH